MARAGGSSIARTLLQELVLALLFAVSATLPAHARGPAPADSRVVSLADLPPEAQQTERLIHSGGPFPQNKDGSAFGNREHLLPRQARGYYREYTVRTPGARDRGARRIVCGGRAAREPDACYYSADHYASFKRIAQ